jgi:hypothetical protein
LAALWVALPAVTGALVTAAILLVIVVAVTYLRIRERGQRHDEGR